MRAHCVKRYEADDHEFCEKLRISQMPKTCLGVLQVISLYKMDEMLQHCC